MMRAAITAAMTSSGMRPVTRHSLLLGLLWVAQAAAGAVPAGNPLAGRPVAPLPFNTPEADAILAKLQVFPPDNPWNLAVDQWPVAANSQALIAGIWSNKPLRYNPDMGFVLVPPGQKTLSRDRTSKW